MAARDFAVSFLTFVKGVGNQLRYVVLCHEGTDEPHFDLMFETAPGSDLETWRATHWPVGGETILTYLNPHRRAYLDYQGPLSGNRGHVKRIAVGRHTIIQDQPDLLTIRLESGTILRLPRR